MRLQCKDIHELLFNISTLNCGYQFRLNQIYNRACYLACTNVCLPRWVTEFIKVHRSIFHFFYLSREFGVPNNGLSLKKVLLACLQLLHSACILVHVIGCMHCFLSLSKWDISVVDRCMLHSSKNWIILLFIYLMMSFSHLLTQFFELCNMQRSTTDMSHLLNDKKQ